MAPQRKKKTAEAMEKTHRREGKLAQLPKAQAQPAAASPASKPTKKPAPRRGGLALLLEESQKWGADPSPQDVPVVEVVTTPTKGKKKAAPKKPAKRKRDDEAAEGVEVEATVGEKGLGTGDGAEAPPPKKTIVERKIPAEIKHPTKTKAPKKDEEEAPVDENPVDQKPAEDQPADADAAISTPSRTSTVMMVYRIALCFCKRIIFSGISYLVKI